jgi:hypothetical protein
LFPADYFSFPVCAASRRVQFVGPDYLNTAR